MTKEQLNAGLLALTVIGSVVCFVAGQAAAGTALLAFAAGHLITSPLPPKADQ